MTSILIMLVVLFGGNLILLMTLIEKHNSFTEHHTTTTLINNPTIHMMSSVRKDPVIDNKDNGTANTKLDDVASVLWSDMTKSQQDKAYKMVLPYINKHDRLLKKRANQGKGNRNKPSYEWSCGAKEVGAGWG